MSTRIVRASVVGATLAALLVAGSSAALGSTSGAVVATRGGARTGVVIVTTRLAYSAQTSAGTGIVLTSSGSVLTNNHVIRGARSIRVIEVSSGRTFTASVAGYSVSKDIALLRLQGARGLQTAPTGNSSTVRIGDRVTAVGNSGGSGTLSTKSGSVTALRQSITVDDEGSPVRLTGLIETNAALRPGDSGGPLLSNGRVIGIDAAASNSFAFRSTGGQGYAVPVNVALQVARQIETGRGTVSVHVGPTAFLGVSLADAAYDRAGVRGAIVDGVASGSPAARAGIGANDLITAFAGRRVSSPSVLKQLVLQSAPGRTVRITWIDPYAGSTSATVRLAAGPPQ